MVRLWQRNGIGGAGRPTPGRVKEVQAVVMAGGRGERLHPLTAVRPKPLVPLFGRPLLGYLVGHLTSCGIAEIFITAGHLGEQIEAYIAGLPADARLHCRVEGTPRGTAGAVADLLPRLRSPFLVVSGDAVIDIDLAAILRAHRQDGNAVTLCLAPPVERLRFGTVALAGRCIRRFLEKPSLADLLPELHINTGCYLIDRGVLEGLPPEGGVDFALDVFPRLLERRQPLGAVQGARFWRDVGTLEAYREAHFDGLRGMLPWRLPAAVVPTGRAGDLVHLGRDVDIAAGARIIGPAVIGDRCRVGREAEVTRCVLLEGASVGPGATIRDCVLDRGARVPAGWRLAGAGVAAGRTALDRHCRRRTYPGRPTAAGTEPEKLPQGPRPAGEPEESFAEAAPAT